MATVKTIDLDQFVKEFGKIRHDSGKFLKRQKKMIIEGVYEGCLRSIQPMAERSPVDTGLYASSWQVQKSGEAVYFGNTAPYAYHLEVGSPPFNAPLQPLLEWAGRKLQKPIDDQEVQRLAWGVKNKFAREGAEPKYILENGMSEVVMPMIKDTIEKNYKKPKYDNIKK